MFGLFNLSTFVSPIVPRIFVVVFQRGSVVQRKRPWHEHLFYTIVFNDLIFLFFSLVFLLSLPWILPQLNCSAGHNGSLWFCWHNCAKELHHVRNTCLVKQPWPDSFRSWHSILCTEFLPWRSPPFCQAFADGQLVCYLQITKVEVV